MLDLTIFLFKKLFYKKSIFRPQHNSDEGLVSQQFRYFFNNCKACRLVRDNVKLYLFSEKVKKLNSLDSFTSFTYVSQFYFEFQRCFHFFLHPAFFTSKCFCNARHVFVIVLNQTISHPLY